MKAKAHVFLIKPLPLRQTDESRHGVFVPLGPLFLAHALIERGYEVSIIDSDNNSALVEIDRTITDKTICFGISTMSGVQLVVGEDSSSSDEGITSMATPAPTRPSVAIVVTQAPISNPREASFASAWASVCRKSENARASEAFLPAKTHKVVAMIATPPAPYPSYTKLS